MSSTKTDSDSSVIFVGEQHIVQLHPDQEQRITFVPETPTRSPATTSTHETGEKQASLRHNTQVHNYLNKNINLD